MAIERNLSDFDQGPKRDLVKEKEPWLDHLAGLGGDLKREVIYKSILDINQAERRNYPKFKMEILENDGDFDKAELDFGDGIKMSISRLSDTGCSVKIMRFVDLPFGKQMYFSYKYSPLLFKSEKDFRENLRQVFENLETKTTTLYDDGNSRNNKPLRISLKKGTMEFLFAALSLKPGTLNTVPAVQINGETQDQGLFGNRR